MKQLSVLFLPLIAILLLSTGTKDKTKPATQAEVTKILDSFKIIQELDALILGTSNPASADEQKYNSIVLSLFRLPFSEAKKMISDPSPTVRAYGLIIACKKYYHELTPTDLKIFNDTSRLKMHTSDGVVQAPFTLGEFAKMIYEAMPAELALSRKEDSAENALDAFIRKYARHQDSYTPMGSNITTSDFQSENYSFQLEHIYSLRNNKNIIVSDTTFFVLNNRFVVIHAGKEDNVNFHLYENDGHYTYGDWLKEFGRDLTRADSAALNLAN
ncbi:MAG TPA: hypothetical protein VEB40_09575 [Flavipsychrobacter sp.]|nr:hypothetical protein [Flavipsychrobacter sp.]